VRLSFLAAFEQRQLLRYVKFVFEIVPGFPISKRKLRFPAAFEQESLLRRVRFAAENVPDFKFVLLEMLKESNFDPKCQILREISNFHMISVPLQNSFVSLHAFEQESLLRHCRFSIETVPELPNSN